MNVVVITKEIIKIKIPTSGLNFGIGFINLAVSQGRIPQVHISRNQNYDSHTNLEARDKTLNDGEVVHVHLPVRSTCRLVTKISVTKEEQQEQIALSSTEHFNMAFTT